MKHALRISLAYMVLSLIWTAGSDWLFASAFPKHFAAIILYKGLAFVLVTSGLLFVLLTRESARRDKIECALRALAVYDPLTGLPNRACFVENLERAVARASRDGTGLGVIFIDLDGFKDVNDTSGHQAGDKLLCEVARRIKAVVRSADSAGRLGGDEFVILAQGDDQDGTRRLAERLVDALKQPFSIEGSAVSVSASVGFALYPDHGQQGEQLLRAADMAMYRVKQTGKNAVLEASAPPVRTETCQTRLGAVAGSSGDRAPSVPAMHGFSTAR